MSSEAETITEAQPAAQLTWADVLAAEKREPYFRDVLGFVE